MQAEVLTKFDGLAQSGAAPTTKLYAGVTSPPRAVASGEYRTNDVGLPRHLKRPVLPVLKPKSPL